MVWAEFYEDPEQNYYFVSIIIITWLFFEDPELKYYFVLIIIILWLVLRIRSWLWIGGFIIILLNNNIVYCEDPEPN